MLLSSFIRCRTVRAQKALARVIVLRSTPTLCAIHNIQSPRGHACHASWKELYCMRKRSASVQGRYFSISMWFIACGLLQFPRQCLVNCPLKRNLLPEVLSDSLAYVVIQILRLHVYLTEREVVVLYNSCSR